MQVEDEDKEIGEEQQDTDIGRVLETENYKNVFGVGTFLRFLLFFNRQQMQILDYNI